jgi:hypothetical protein
LLKNLASIGPVCYKTTLTVPAEPTRAIMVIIAFLDIFDAAEV